MDLAHRHHIQNHPLGLFNDTQSYGLQGEPSTGPFGIAMETQRIPRSLGPHFNLQTSILNQPSPPGLSADQLWPQRILNEIRDLLFLLSPDGRVMYTSPSCKSITGFDTGQLEHNLLSRFIHDDDKATFAREVEDSMATGRPLRCHFRVYKIDNTSCLLEANGHPHITTLNVQDGHEKQFCSGIFLMCRPYPTRSLQLLDSFLEHKIENIRLTQRIKQLKDEEEEDLNASQQANQAYAAVAQAVRQREYATAGSSGYTAGADASTSSEENESSDTLANADDTDSQPLLDQAISHAIAQGEDLSHIDGVELITGLHFGEGERSQGISTGVRHGRLVQCTGSSSSERDERRKRLKGEYMCSDCGTSDSPEWRKGPEGPKTLCNACGLRWAKREKKRQDS